MATKNEMVAVYEGMTDSAYAEYLPATVSMSDVMGYADGTEMCALSDSEATAIATAINERTGLLSAGRIPTTHEEWLRVQAMSEAAKN